MIINYNLKTFVALVCTNQWNDSDEKRAKVMEDYHNLLTVSITITIKSILI